LQRTIEEEDWVPLDYQQRSDPAALGEILCSRQTDSGRAGMKTTMKPEEYFEQLGK
jgi:hypothetical protein